VRTLSVLVVVLCLLPGSALAGTIDSAAALREALAQAQPGETVSVGGGVLGGLVEGPLVLERVGLRAPGARVRVVRDGRETVLSYPQRYLFAGRADRPGQVRVGLLFDPRSASLTGAVAAPDGLHRLSFSDDGERVRAVKSGAELPEGVELDVSCGNGSLNPSHGVPSLHDDLLAGVLGRGARGALRYGLLAIDTDREWLDRRFNDDTMAAAQWIEELFMFTNTLFKSQLDLRMLQGETILRVGSDPFMATGSPASPAQLDEFGTHWANNLGHVDRTHAALISGLSPSAFSASGIAWVDSYCENQSTGGSYSVNQLFYSSSVGVDSSARLFAHELGHNLGSVHTHCYDPPVDQCYAQEPGCYSGPTSCPGGGDNAGTLMSYCNIKGCGPSNQNLLELAPTVASLLNQRVSANTPSCLAEDAGDTIIFQDRFEP